jgi:hypothetical protein
VLSPENSYNPYHWRWNLVGQRRSDVKLNTVLTVGTIASVLFSRSFLSVPALTMGIFGLSTEYS